MSSEREQPGSGQPWHQQPTSTESRHSQYSHLIQPASAQRGESAHNGAPERLYEQALAIFRKTLPSEHPHIALVERGLEAVKKAPSEKQQGCQFPRKTAAHRLLCAGK